jgi:ribosomal protein S18 acetylase RimI-like enzyme
MTITYTISPAVTNEALNELFGAAWDNHTSSDFTPILSRSLLYVCAYNGSELIGYVNVAWDGGIHAFLLDTTVDPRWRRQRIGEGLVRRAAKASRARGIVWLHVDYEPHLEAFYRGCGFSPTAAGLIRLQD